MKTVAAQVLDPTHLELEEPLSLESGVKISVVIREDESSASAMASTESDAPRQLRFREREHAWRRIHREVLRSLEGQWVVLEGEEIVAHGEDPVELVERARGRGIASPYVFYVEPRPPGVVKIGL